MAKSMADFIQDVLYGLITKLLGGIKVNSVSHIEFKMPEAEIIVFDNSQIADKSRDNKLLNNLDIKFRLKVGAIDLKIPLTVVGDIDEAVKQ